MPSEKGLECTGPLTRSHWCQFWLRRHTSKAGNPKTVPAAGNPVANSLKITQIEAGVGPCGLLSCCHSEHSMQGSSSLIWLLDAWPRDNYVLSWRVRHQIHASLQQPVVLSILA